MLKNQVRKITLTSNSIITLVEGDSTREVSVEGYTCSIDSDNPEKMSVSKYFVNKEAEELYVSNRATCRADYAAFTESAYALQDELIAEKQAAAE